MQPKASPSETLLTDIAITLLTPFFLAAAQGNQANAREAARSMLAAYGTNSDAELLTAVQILAFVMATISTLSIAMTGNLPAPLMLRAMSCAASLGRAEERHRRILQAQQQQSRPKPPPMDLPADFVMPSTRPAAPLGPDDFTQEEQFELMQAAMHGTIPADAQGNPVVPEKVQVKWRKAFGDQIMPYADELMAGAGALPPMECEIQRDKANRVRLSALALQQGKPMPKFANGSIFAANG